MEQTTQQITQERAQQTAQTKLFGTLNVWKNYGSKQVLKGVNFSLPLGGIVGIFGLNGSGKTTLLKILSGLDGRYRGSVMKKDFDDVAYMSVEGGYPMDMRVKDIIRFFGKFCPQQNTEKILSSLSDAGIKEKNTLLALSSGMKQYLKFLLTVYSGASVCLFDEPFSNLDVNMREKIAKTLILESNGNRLFLITTHELKEVETLIDGFLILKDGRLSAYYVGEEVRETTGKSIAQFYKEKVNG
ncbi:MAG: ABC transporter ATP-binding protein [Clostridia bacterium]|nr:ABC transporter ATP-binding protein [Clostridia bacterium]